MNAQVYIVLIVLLLIALIFGFPYAVTWITEREKMVTPFFISRLVIAVVATALSLPAVGFTLVVLVEFFSRTQSAVKFDLGVIGLCCWIAFVVLAKYWVENRRAPEPWVVAATVCPFLVFPIANIFSTLALPAIILNFYMVFFHFRFGSKVDKHDALT
jgi:hypothetical protein